MSDKLTATHEYILNKKEDINRNMENSDGVQREIHEYIQRDSTRIPKPLGPELLVQLWEFHLVKVGVHIDSLAPGHRLVYFVARPRVKLIHWPPVWT